MTVLNIAVGDDAVALICDSLVTEAGAAPSHVSKVLAFPALRAAVGVVGHLSLLDDFARLLQVGLPYGTTAEDLVRELPQALATAWARIPNAKHSHAILTGAVGERVVAYVLASPQFVPYQLERGVYAHPPRDPAPTRDWSATVEPAKPPPPMPQEVAVLPWHRLVQEAVAVVREQHKAHRVAIGGTVTMTTITTAQVAATWLMELHQGAES